MQMFEYVIVLISIVIGLALTHLMYGIAELIQNPRRTRLWWVHLVWIAYMFLSIVSWWWWEFRFQHIRTWSFAIYLFVIFYAFYLYLICAVLFPRSVGGYDGYRGLFPCPARLVFRITDLMVGDRCNRHLGQGPGLFCVAWRYGIDLQRSARSLQHHWDSRAAWNNPGGHRCGSIDLPRNGRAAPVQCGQSCRVDRMGHSVALMAGMGRKLPFSL